MPITPYLDGQKFDLETKRIIGRPGTHQLAFRHRAKLDFHLQRPCRRLIAELPTGRAEVHFLRQRWCRRRATAL